MARRQPPVTSAAKKPRLLACTTRGMHPRDPEGVPFQARPLFTRGS
ncbi:MAG: hypothetical protein RL562_3536 [Planctomycetota bacterium]